MPGTSFQNYRLQEVQVWQFQIGLQPNLLLPGEKEKAAGTQRPYLLKSPIPQAWGANWLQNCL